jgi:hypothetical protein
MSNVNIFATQFCKDLLRPNVTWKMKNIKLMNDEYEIGYVLVGEITLTLNHILFVISSCIF